MERLEEEIEWHFDRFVQKIQQLQDAQCSLSPWKERAKVRIKKGRVYWAIWVDLYEAYLGFEEVPENPMPDSQRIFGFVRRKDGAILRAATWRAPEVRTKTAIRGYVCDENSSDYFNEYGIIYAPTA